jgi:hypothetical protein
MQRLVSLVFLLSLSVPAINAQLTTQSAPSRAELRAQHDRAALSHVAPLKDFEQFAPYWTAEGGWHTELQLRNNLASGNLVVTPSLRTADGTETALNPITLLPGEVQSVDLNKALTAVNSNLAGKANAYGSIVIRYNSKGLRNLYASVMVHDTGRPIMYHLDAASQASKYVSGSREGIWWLPTKTTRDYLILTNQSDHELHGTLWLYGGGGEPWSQPLQLGARQTQRLSVRQLLSIAGLHGLYGGIKIDMPEGAGSLDAAHILYDEVAGFSATMKMFDYNPQTKIAEHDFAGKGVWITRAPMLALSHPDPVLAFPAKTVLQPQLLLRNTTAKPAKVDLGFHWRDATEDGRASIPEITLAPFETRKLDVQDLQNKGVIPSAAFWAQVTMTTNTLPNEVMAVAASYDATLRYGAQTPFSDQLIAHLEGGEWKVDANHTSLIAAGNGGSKPVNAALTFFYDQGQKQYRLEQTIAPDDQWWVDIGQLIHNQSPDANGNTLPADLSSGAYQLRAVGDSPQDFLYEGKVITDKTYGHATYGCMICCGYGGDAGLPFLLADPTRVAVAGSTYADVLSTNACTGSADNVDGYFPSWWSSDNSILTADSFQITGVAVGSTYVNASATGLPSGDGEDSPYGCPAAPAQGTGTGNVQVPTALNVMQVAVLPTGTTGDYGCQPLQDNGIKIAVTYQVVDQSGAAILDPTMEPQETITGQIFNGTSQPNIGLGDIGPSRISGTSQFTDSNGRFKDAPYGICSAQSLFFQFTQNISILFQGTSYPVKTNVVNVLSSLPGHGSLTNNNDISAAR